MTRIIILHCAYPKLEGGTCGKSYAFDLHQDDPIPEFHNMICKECFDRAEAEAILDEERHEAMLKWQMEDEHQH